MKRLPHSFYFLKVKLISVHPYIFIFMLQFCWKNILDETKHTCYKIYGNFNFAHIINP